MKYYRIYLLLLSTVCVNPFLHSSDYTHSSDVIQSQNIPPYVNPPASPLNSSFTEEPEFDLPRFMHLNMEEVNQDNYFTTNGSYHEFQNNRTSFEDGTYHWESSSLISSDIEATESTDRLLTIPEPNPSASSSLNTSGNHHRNIFTANDNETQNNAIHLIATLHTSSTNHSLNSPSNEITSDSDLSVSWDNIKLGPPPFIDPDAVYQHDWIPFPSVSSDTKSAKSTNISNNWLLSIPDPNPSTSPSLNTSGNQLSNIFTADNGYNGMQNNSILYSSSTFAINSQPEGGNILRLDDNVSTASSLKKRKRKMKLDGDVSQQNPSKKSKKDETTFLDTFYKDLPAFSQLELKDETTSLKEKREKEKRKKLLETFCEDLPAFSQLELTVFEKKILEKMFDDILDALEFSSIKEKSLHYKCQFFVKFIYQLFGTPEEFKSLKTEIKKLFDGFEQKDNEIDTNKLCDCILCYIHNYSSRSTAFVSKLSELLGLGSTYLTTQSHTTVSKFFQDITNEEEELLGKFFEEKTDTFKEKTALFYPDGQDEFNLSKVFYNLYNKKLRTLDKNFPRTFYLQNSLKQFIQVTLLDDTLQQDPSSSVVLTSETSFEKEEILDEVLTEFFKTFLQSEYEDYSAFINAPSFNKKRFLKLMLEKLLLNNTPKKFKELLDKASKKDDNALKKNYKALKKNDTALKKEKSNLCLYTYYNLYKFTSPTLKTFHYISKDLGLDFEMEIPVSFNGTSIIKQYENIEEDIEKLFGYDKSAEEINKIYDSKDLFSEFNAKIKSVYRKHQHTIDSQQGLSVDEVEVLGSTQ